MFDSFCSLRMLCRQFKVEIFDAVNWTLFSVQLRMLRNKWLLAVAIVGGDNLYPVLIYR